ncbi:protein TRIGALACTOSYLDIACYLGLYCEROL 3, chloroplastic-like [Silene latifolia]|uniref:protein TRIGALACTOSYLDIACYLGLYCEROL 3, chloroplastic-like n=1 Tax=Silene latifolia TaxID=37657 RepID=UPI003D78A0FA
MVKVSFQCFETHLSLDIDLDDSLVKISTLISSGISSASDAALVLQCSTFNIMELSTMLALIDYPWQVLLYDEPTAGLDPIASTVVEDLIRSVHLKGEDAAGKTGNVASYVVVTHQHSTIRRAVDRLIFLYEGEIVWEGLTHEFSASTNPIVQQFATGSLEGPIKY